MGTAAGNHPDWQLMLEVLYMFVTHPGVPNIQIATPNGHAKELGQLVIHLQPNTDAQMTAAALMFFLMSSDIMRDSDTERKLKLCKTLLQVDKLLDKLIPAVHHALMVRLLDFTAPFC